jgi:predicted DNA-binding transcriptional regulator AlpA
MSCYYFWCNHYNLLYLANNQATSDGQVGPGVRPPPANQVDSIVMYSHTDVYLNTSAVMNATGISLTYFYDFSKDISEGYMYAMMDACQFSYWMQ